jgi:hypothetical protein
LTWVTYLWFASSLRMNTNPAQTANNTAATMPIDRSFERAQIFRTRDRIVVFGCAGASG